VKLTSPRLPAEYAVELGRVADRLVHREREVHRIEDEVHHAPGAVVGLALGQGLGCPLPRPGGEIGLADELVPGCPRAPLVIARLRLAAVDRRRPHARDGDRVGEVQVAVVGGRDDALHSDERERPVRHDDAGRVHHRIAAPQKQFHLLGRGDAERVLLAGGRTRLHVRGLGCELDRVWLGRARRGPGGLDGMPGRAGDAVVVEIRARGEPPAPVEEQAHRVAGALGVVDGLHRPPRDMHAVSSLADDPHVGVLRPRVHRRRHRDIGVAFHVVPHSDGIRSGRAARSRARPRGTPRARAPGRPRP